jgi:hypothetical protein
LVLFLWALTMTAGRAAASTTCGSTMKHWAIQEGSVPLKVRWVELRIEVCTDGSELTSSSATSDKDTTGTGTTAGFVVGASDPYRTSFDSGGFGGGSTGFSADGATRDCLPGGITVFCSYTDDWRVNGHVAMLNALNIKASGPSEIAVNRRVFQFTWSAGCTNRACKTRFS